MRKLRYIIATAVTSILLLSPVAALAQPVYVGTASSDDACETLKNLNPDSKGCGTADNGVNKIIKVAINLISVIAAVIAVIMIIVSGFKYITARGDSNQITSARNSLLYAIVGLVVVAFAQVIVRFVLAKSIHA